jgi:hypothetical protein
VPAGGGGADLVEIASDRLQSICEAIGASGGVLTPELKDDVSSVVALLEAVAPDDDDDLDEEEQGVAPMGPGEGVTGNAKRAEAIKAWRVGKKTLVGSFAKAAMSPEAFIAKVSRWLVKFATTRNADLRKMRGAAIQKMLTFGPEVFGDRNFAMTGADVPAIPMYTEAFVDTHVADEKVPSEEPVKSAFAYDPTYTPNENSQVAFDAGSPQLMEKADKARTQLAGLLGVKTGAAAPAAAPAPAAVTVAKADAACKACGAPMAEGAEKCAKCGAMAKAGPAGDPAGVMGNGPHATDDTAQKGRLNTEKDAWTSAYVNELPDSAFLYVEPGGKKDAAGRTVPGDLRHFPFKDQNGKTDLPHLRDALSRIPDSGISDDKKKELTAHAQSLLEEADGAQKSAVEKSLRGDDGWPDDMADPAFLKGSEPTRRIRFGFDGLTGKSRREQQATAAAK